MLQAFIVGNVMSDRHINMRLACTYAGEENSIAGLEVEHQIEGEWQSLELGVTSPGFDIFVYSLLHCQHTYFRLNCAERGLILGSATGIADGDPTSADAQLESDQAAGSFGIRVASAGDVNGDLYDDVIVGATLYDAGQTDEGAAFIFLGSATGLADGDPGNAATRLEGSQVSARFGSGVGGAGDIDGDGYDDVVVGAHLFDSGQQDEGAAFLPPGHPGPGLGPDPEAGARLDCFRKAPSPAARRWVGARVHAC